MQLKRIIAVSSIVLGSTAVLLVTVYIGWVYFSGAQSMCAGQNTRLLERATEAQVAADAAARRAEAEKTDRARELAVEAAGARDKAIADAKKEIASMKAKSLAEKERRASLWSSCHG